MSMKANELKSTDLMVGDWVIVKGVPTKIYDIDKIDGINREWIAGCEDGGCTCYKDIQPIPLTPEILKKNGFDNIDNMYPFPTFRCDDKENYLCITIGFPEGDKTKRKYPFIEIDGKDIFVEYLIINFVHELQHVLRLCRIEKEIVV